MVTALRNPLRLLCRRATPRKQSVLRRVRHLSRQLAREPSIALTSKSTHRRMPIFQKKFALKIAPPRTRRLNIGCPAPPEDLDDFRTVTLNLVDKQLCFVDGVWLNGLKPPASAAAASGSAGAHSVDDLLRMKRRVKTLEQENNMLQVKLDVLVDLLTENVLELNAAKNQ